MSTVQKMIGIAGFVFVLGLGVEDASGACPEYPEGFTCQCNAAETEWVCAKWAAPGTPTHEFDFEVTYVSDVPNVTLKVADLGWELYSEVISTGAAADMGTLALDNSGSIAFKVKIANGAGPGAVNVGTINLDDAGFTGSSSIAGISFISGDLGGLTLVNGGVLDGLAVLGNLTGPLTVPTVKQSGPIPSVISGNVIGAADITIGKIENGALTIGLSLVCDGAVCPDITVTDKILNGSLVVGVDVPSGSIITINELIDDPATGVVTMVDLSDVGEFAGTLDLPNGLANANTLIDMGGEFSGVIDFHGGAVAGEYAGYVATTTAEIKNGGAVSGVVYLSQNIPGFDYQYEGTATFASVTSTGEIGTQALNPDISAHFPGILNVTSGVAGLIEIAGSHLLGAQINIGSLSGDIEIEDDCVGSLSIAGTSKGDVHIEGDLSGSITMDGTLGGVGRILVDGLTDGAIRIGKKTTSLTLIHLPGGLGEFGTIEINTSQGAFNAEGVINVGSAACVLDPPNVTFDGCIRIYDQAPSENFGDLLGAIIVSGCHLTTDTLNICVDGDAHGNVNICQNDCPNQVGWSCPIPACP